MPGTLVPAIVVAVAVLAPPAGATGAGSHARSSAAGRADGETGSQAGYPFCQKLNKQYWGSSGAQMYCRGPQFQQGSQTRRAAVSEPAGAPANTDAARVSEDRNSAGVPAQGQSEVSVAAAGPYVVEAWNDATGFITDCGAPMAKEELTGLGFSANGGKSFTDLGGLPNLNCGKFRYEGDPSVAAYQVGGHTYFYISSLFDPVNFAGPSEIALDACTVEGSGSAAALSCGQPVVAASSTSCRIFKFGRRTVEFCSFLDKDFLAIDPARGRLYVTYSDFRINGPGDPVDMSACDLGNAVGGAGPAGGTPAHPVCEHGTPLVHVSPRLLVAKPYLTIARPDPRGCENEGSMPAVDAATGTAYVAYEYNIGSSLGFPLCSGSSTPVQDVLTKVAARCLTLTKVSPCPGTQLRIRVPIVTLSSTFVPGYNRFPANDFPRLAVSDRFGTVSMVWNDARFHPYGDILLQSFRLPSLRPVQRVAVRLDQPHNGGLSMLPAVRGATRSGLLDVSWFSRASVATSVTNVAAAVGVSPVTRTTPPNTRITNAGSNWLNDASLIVPNFGDYTDSAVSVTGQRPFVGNTVFFVWSDGRLGIPQPFEAHLPAG